MASWLRDWPYPCTTLPPSTGQLQLSLKGQAAYAASEPLPLNKFRNSKMETSCELLHGSPLVLYLPALDPTRMSQEESRVAPMKMLTLAMQCLK